MAALKFGPTIQKEQEVLAWLADMVIDTFALESAVLRARKLEAAGQDTALVKDMVDVLIARTSMRLLDAGSQALAHNSDGDDLRVQLAGLKRFAKVPEAIDTASVRRKTATTLVEAGGYAVTP